jgi:MFS family permease
MVILFGQTHASLRDLSTLAAVTEFFSIGAMVGLYALVTRAYPTNVRAGGTGFVMGVGRGGAALGPIIAGLLFQSRVQLPAVAVIMALGSLLAAVAIAALRVEQTATL